MGRVYHEHVPPLPKHLQTVCLVVRSPSRVLEDGVKLRNLMKDSIVSIGEEWVGYNKVHKLVI